MSADTFSCETARYQSGKHRRYIFLNSFCTLNCDTINLIKHVMLQQFNFQQLYVLPTLYLCVLYLSENIQRLVPLTA